VYKISGLFKDLLLQEKPYICLGALLACTRIMATIKTDDEQNPHRYKLFKSNCIPSLCVLVSDLESCILLLITVIMHTHNKEMKSVWH